MEVHDWLQTYSGKMFYPGAPTPDMIEIEDIAHALSMMCRFNGHCKEFYSVAEHSVGVANHCAPEYALWGLLHDASEAYIADIVKPAKPYIPGYFDLEKNIMSVIATKFGLSEIMPKEVKKIDVAILADEMQQLLGPAPSPWILPEKPLGIKLQMLQPKQAKELFLETFYRLT